MIIIQLHRGAPYKLLAHVAQCRLMPLMLWMSATNLTPLTGMLMCVGSCALLMICECGDAGLCSDIRRLWKLTGQRYGASKQQTNLTVGKYTIWDDMPTAPDQVMPLPMYVMGSCYPLSSHAVCLHNLLLSPLTNSVLRVLSRVLPLAPVIHSALSACLFA